MVRGAPVGMGMQAWGQLLPSLHLGQLLLGEAGV